MSPLILAFAGVFINYVPTEPINFATTSNWTSWSDVEIAAALSQGEHTIRLETTGVSGANIDSLRIEPPLPAPYKSLFEAEDAEFSPEFKVVGGNGSTGTGFLDIIGEGYVEWKIDVPAAGAYTLVVSYGLKAENRPLLATLDYNQPLQEVVHYVVSGKACFQGSPCPPSWGPVVENRVCLPSCNPVDEQKVYGFAMPNMGQEIGVASAGSVCVMPFSPHEYAQPLHESQIWGYWISDDREIRGRTACEAQQ